MTTTTTPPSAAQAAQREPFHLLARDPGKRRTEIVYAIWFPATLPLQAFVTHHLSFDEPNDFALVSQGLLMGLGALLLPVLFRAPSDRGRPLHELYAVRMGAFLTIWAVLGGFIGTDPWYEVMSGHFAFNTDLNPNGVPLFMLPMTIAVFGFYSVILGTLYRVAVQLLDRTGVPALRESVIRHGLLCAVLAVLMPLVETLAYTSPNYCFDHDSGQWGLNVLIYGSWHFAALLFYTRFDVEGYDRPSLKSTLTAAFATLGILMCLMAVTKTFIAPQFVEVQHGVRNLNDWSPDNCLGEKPE